ncbi:MAG: carboxymuconolactone decarboxylase family protein [Mucilaginibacter sp.]
MNTRVKIDKAQPAVYNAVLTLEKSIHNTVLTAKHRELIKIRASQINGCAYCIDMHTRDARKGGETEQRIYGLNAWRDTPFYDEQERALLALTEDVTLISKGGVSEETYNNAAVVFDEEYIAAAIMAIVTINVWNRIAISTHLQPALV